MESQRKALCLQVCSIPTQIASSDGSCLCWPQTEPSQASVLSNGWVPGAGAAALAVPEGSPVSKSRPLHEDQGHSSRGLGRRELADLPWEAAPRSHCFWLSIAPEQNSAGALPDGSRAAGLLGSVLHLGCQGEGIPADANYFQTSFGKTLCFELLLL